MTAGRWAASAGVAAAAIATPRASAGSTTRPRCREDLRFVGSVAGTDREHEALSAGGSERQPHSAERGVLRTPIPARAMGDARRAGQLHELTVTIDSASAVSPHSGLAEEDRLLQPLAL